MDITYWTQEKANALVGRDVRTKEGAIVRIVTKICVSQKADQWMVVDSNNRWYKKVGNSLYYWA